MNALERRYLTRRAIARGLPEFDGTLDRVLVVPRDRDGRPGYRLTTAGESQGIRQPSVRGTTCDFFIKYAPRSHMIGTCIGRATDASPHARATAGVKDVLESHAQHRPRIVVPPSPSELAGAPAALYTAEMTEGRLTGLVLTDRFFDHGGWSFMVGTLHHPRDEPETSETARAILASWVWLPDDAEA